MATIAVTGGTGFIGISLIGQLVEAGHQVRAWHRPDSNLAPLQQHSANIEWLEGELGDGQADRLVDGCDAMVHAAVWRDNRSFQAAPDDLVEYARRNVLGSLELMQAAVAADLERFVFVSTCAVHDVILEDRPLDEAHPLWARTHYGAHKAALEKFVHSYGLGMGFPICAVRPTGVYGLKQPVQHSKWYDLVAEVEAGRPVICQRGGKEVHVDDVAAAIRLLLDAEAEQIAGQSFSCYDRYISEYDVATIARELTGTGAQIVGEPRSPRHEIETKKIRDLGMKFGGTVRLRSTVETMLEQISG